MYCYSGILQKMKKIQDIILGDLADPQKFQTPLEIKGQNPQTLKAMLAKMWQIRRAEETIAENIENGKIVCPCHLAIGQEAVGTGVSLHLKTSDRVFGNHRSHAHYLALDGSLSQLFSEVLGKADGASKGMGGSMHLYAGSNGFKGSVPIVAGTIPIAVGAGLAAQKDKKNPSDIAVSYFGDGASEEGVFHESLNLAANFKLPVLFVCEHNLFSSHLHIDLRQPGDAISRYALAHHIPYELVDGNDIVAVSKAAQKLIEAARSGQGPGFLEAVTYRWRGHVGPKEDIDVGVKRKDDLHIWKKRDPIARLAQALIVAKFLTTNEYDQIKIKIESEIQSAWEKALKAPYPESSALMEMVYAK